MKHIAIGIFGAAALGLMASAASAGTLDTVKAKGFIQCGVSTGLAYTEAGGEVLYVEASLLPDGKGLRLSGQLG